MLLSIAKLLLTFVTLCVISKVTFLGWYELHFSDTSLFEFIKAVFWGTRFDLTVSFLLTGLSFLFFIPLVKFKKLYKILFLIWVLLCGAWIIFSTMGDAVYLSQANRHVTVDMHLGKGMELELLSTVVTQYSGLVFTAVALFVVFSVVAVKYPQQISVSDKWYKTVVIGLALIVATVTAVRGGYSDKPQSPMYAYKIGDIKLARIAWSAPYAITYYSIIGEDKSGHRWTPVQSIEQMERLRTVVNPAAETKLDDLQKYDLVFFFFKQKTAYEMKGYGSEFDSTPNFDALREKSLSTTSFYSNGFRTVEGVFTTMCSMPNPVGGSVAGTRLESMPYHCLPQILKERGWNTSFVQGSGQGMVGAFAQSLGFAHSYGKFDYLDTNQDTNYWGYMDDGIYDFALGKLAKAGEQPQFIAINTGTTHDSYLPNESDYVFGRANTDETRRSVLHHADRALGRFVTKLEAQARRPTLLVLVADHTMVSSNNDLRHVFIPFLIHGINLKIPTGIMPVAASHKDVAPTVIDMLGGAVSWFSGNSLLSNNYREGADFTVNNRFYWLTRNKLVQINAETGKREKCFSVASNSNGLQPTACEELLGADELYRKGLNYLFYSQQHLFEGTTTSY